MDETWWYKVYNGTMEWGGGDVGGHIQQLVDVEGVVSMYIVVGDQRLAVEFVVVSAQSVRSLLGIDILKRHACVINLHNMVMQCHRLNIPLETSGNGEQDDSVCQAKVTLMENLTSSLE